MAGRSNTALRVALVGVLVIAGLAGGYGTAARFSDTEERTVAVEAAVPTTQPTTVRPATGTPNTETPTTRSPTETPREPGPSRPAISFVAVCYPQGSQVGEVGVRATEFKNGDPTEPMALQWRSADPVSSVVLKAGRTVERFDGGARGNAVVGEGTPTAGSPARPCPANERLLVKFEWNGNSFTPETER